MQAELTQEEKDYKQAKELKGFLAKTPFKFLEAPGDVNMALEREIDGGKVVRIEWQLSGPLPSEEEIEEPDEQEDGTELTVTVEDKNTGAGLTFYCSTGNGEEPGYIIGSVKAYASAQEKESISSYNGPDFDDLDDKLQEAFDGYLAELGLSSEVCDFVDGMAMDKEQREHVRWLQTAKGFLESPR